MKCTVEDEFVAIPCFGLNSPKHSLGALMITSRADSATAQVSVLSSTPDGRLEDSMVIAEPTNVDALAMVSTVLPAQSGFIFDGVDLCDVWYVVIEVTGRCVIDVSFVPNRVPVDLGKAGGLI